MTRAGKYSYGVLFILVVSALLGFFISRTYETQVSKGFAYGDPKSQTVVATKGTYTDKEYGFPATYREVETFKPADGSYASGSFERQPRKWFFLLANVVFWASLLTVLFTPFVMLAEKAKKRNEVKPTDEKMPSQVKKP